MNHFKSVLNFKYAGKVDINFGIFIQVIKLKYLIGYSNYLNNTNITCTDGLLSLFVNLMFVKIISSKPKMLNSFMTQLHC